jgi:hypothetical protein
MPRRQGGKEEKEAHHHHHGHQRISYTKSSSYMCVLCVWSPSQMADREKKNRKSN